MLVDSKIKAYQLFDKGILDTLTVGTFSALSQIHQYLFDEIYEFAGKIRKVNIAKGNIGKVVDWSKVDKSDYLLAMERSPIKDLEIKYLLNNALTDNIQDREVYMKGIDASYHYEGYSVYKSEDLL